MDLRGPMSRRSAWKKRRTPCTLCSAVAYCCGAVALRAIAALLGRFLPRLGPPVHSPGGPFFLQASPRSFPGRDAARSFCEALLRKPGSYQTRCPRRPRLCSAPLRKGCALRCVRGTRGGYSAAAWKGPRSASGMSASASASAAKSATTCVNRGPRSRRRSSM